MASSEISANISTVGCTLVDQDTPQISSFFVAIQSDDNVPDGKYVTIQEQ